jgi:hypothetical protein
MLKKLILSLAVFMAIPSFTMQNDAMRKSVAIKLSTQTNKNIVKSGYVSAFSLISISPINIIAAPFTLSAGIMMLGGTALFEYLTSEPITEDKD